MSLSEIEQRVADLATANGFKLDARAASAAIAKGLSGWTPDTHQAVQDSEILPLLQHAADQAHAKATDAIHPVNAHLVGKHPAEFLAQLQGLSFEGMSAAERMTFWRSYQAHGSIHGAKSDPAAQMRSESEAMALAALERGAGAAVDESGNLVPADMTAVDRLKLARAEGRIAPVNAVPRPVALSDLPTQFRGLLGGDKLAALARVRAADVARDALAAHAAGGRQMSASEQRQARDTVSLGAGGSVKRGVR